MSAMCIGVTLSLPSHNPNASRMDKRLVQLTRMDGRTTQMAVHDDNPTMRSKFVRFFTIVKTTL